MVEHGKKCDACAKTSLGKKRSRQGTSMLAACPLKPYKKAYKATDPAGDEVLGSSSKYSSRQKGNNPGPSLEAEQRTKV
jgi:hypothetical protein